MNVAPHLIRLYIKTSRRYKKLLSRLGRGSVTAYERKTFLHQLRKLYRKLRGLHAQLKIAATTGAVALVLHAGPAQAQTTPPKLGPFVQQDRLNNPLREPLFTGHEPALTVVDFDNDGDFDVVVGEYDYFNTLGGGFLRYFENQTTQGVLLYTELSAEKNPFDGIHPTTYAVAPAFADIDEDGDLDLFLGHNGGAPYPLPTKGIEYYRNDGGTFTKQTGTWNESTKEGNPFEGVTLGDHVRPVFVDFDKDGDQDVIIGSYLWTGSPSYTTEYVHYYRNNGSGTFSKSPLTLDTDPSIWGAISPALSDMDGDGDYDLLLGSYNYDKLFYYRQDTPGSFVRENAPWDPVAKSGNPFDAFALGQNASPAFIDFDQDGHLDVFVADEESPYGYKYSDNIINYYENNGTGSFIVKDDFENPFDGAFVKADAAPVLIDIDNDSDLDAVIGQRYQSGYYDQNGFWVTTNSYLTYYQKTGDLFKKLTGETNPFDTLQVYGNFAPQFADVDGDADLDIISGDGYGTIVFFRNDGASYFDATDTGVFAGINGNWDTAVKLADIDDDGDLDLFLTDGYGEMRFFQNTGTAQAPAYTELFGMENPLYSARFFTWATAYLSFVDLDHDGDLDLTFNGSNPYNVELPAMIYMENTGTAQSPAFETAEVTLFQDMNERAITDFVDYDGDGDLDVFAGIDDGSVNYLENQNPSVITTVTPTAVLYDYRTGAPVIIEPSLTLEDADADTIAFATVTIDNFQAGETLAYLPEGGITGVFDGATGVLTLRGKATLATYQALLRTVTFEVNDAGGRKRAPEKSIIDKTIRFAVYDQDFTTPQAAVKSLQIFVNDPPTISAHSISVIAKSSATVDLKTLIADPNGAADLDLPSLAVIQAPVSGAVTAIDANGILTINYSGLDFLGMETLTVEVCDIDGLCAQNTLTVTVTNTPPVIAPETITTPPGMTKTINLMAITSDVDDNLDPGAFTVLQGPSSGASASIEVVSPTVVNLLLDYQGITFQGQDQLTISACDLAGACTENILVVEVDVVSDVVVYNAVAPNSPGDNRFMRITGLPQNNKVTIFNRWGDKVFGINNYGDNESGNVFRGLNDNGNALPSGTYFYSIEGSEIKMITGYLILKQ